MSSAALRGQESHGPSYICRSGSILSILLDGTTRDSIDPGFRVELRDLISDGVEKAIVQTGLPCSNVRAGLGFCHDNGRADQLSARCLLVLAHASQEMLNGKKRATDIHSIVLFPFVQRQVPDGILFRLILQTGVDN